MIAQAPIAAKLKAAGFARIEGALEYAALKEAPRVVPALYIMPTGERASPNRMSGVHDQKVDGSFSVILIMGASTRVGELSEELTEAVNRIVDALIGWSPAQGVSPINYDGGRLLSADGYRIAWEVRFICDHHIRKARQ